MAALTVKDIVIGQKLKCASKNDPTVKFKVEVEEVIKAAGKVAVKFLEGANEGNSAKVSVERLSRMQGRQPGFSPASAKKTETAKKPATKTSKKAEVSEDELNLESAKAELVDLAELLLDLGKRAERLHEFFDTYKENEEEEEDADESEEEEEDVKPAPKKTTVKKTGTKSRTKVMSEDD